MTDTLIILQARTSSTRLPGKVLLPILDKPMLSHQIARLKGIKTAHKLIIATSELESDDGIADLCQALNVSCFRGSLDDVLDRYYQAAKANNPNATVKTIVRVTGDCPVIDSEIIDKVIELFHQSGADYCSNCDPATLPDGLDVEVFTFAALTKAWHEAKKPSEREHVTPYIRNNKSIFTCANYTHPNDLSHYRLTVDEGVDFELITQIYQALYPIKPAFNLSDIITFLQQNPELGQLNQHIIRNEGLIKSELADQEQHHD